MKVKSEKYGNMSLVDFDYIESHHLSYVDTIHSKTYGNIDVYENTETYNKYAVIIRD